VSAQASVIAYFIRIIHVICRIILPCRRTYESNQSNARDSGTVPDKSQPPQMNPRDSLHRAVQKLDAEFDQQATVVGRLSITLGDGGRAFSKSVVSDKVSDGRVLIFSDTDIFSKHSIE